MRSTAIAAAVSVALLAPLAGCLGGADGTKAAATGEELDRGVEGLRAGLDDAGQAIAQLAATDPLNLSVPAPRWSVGDSWTFTTVDAEGGGDPATLVVSAASGPTYTIATTSERMALYDALFDVSYVGTITADHLAGAQGGSPVRFFDFPLKDGKTWTATWDGLEVTILAKVNPAIDTPMGKQPGFELVASLPDGAPHVAYNYVPAVKWWTRILFSEGYGLELRETKSNWTGDLIAPVAEELLTIGSVGPAARGPGGSFTVAEGQTMVAMVIMGASHQQVRAMLITDGAHQPVFPEGGEDVVYSAEPRREWRIESLPPTPGQWHVALGMLHDPEAHYMFAFHQVAMTPVTLA